MDGRTRSSTGRKGILGRLSASLLVHGNQGQWLARNKNEFVRIASKLALLGPKCGPT